MPAAMATSSTKTSLEAIPILKGRNNYTSWAKQMESHLKATNAWEIIMGRWERPPQPSFFQAPVRPVDLIAVYRRRRQELEDAHQEGDDPLPPATVLNTREAREELQYIKEDIEQWNTWNKAERMAINDINSRISDTCKEELGSLDELTSIWKRLKTLYVESTCGTWVKELNVLFKLKGGRKTGENPDEWIRKMITTGRSIVDNLGEINMDILLGYLLTVDLGEDLTATTTETYRQSRWPSVDSIRTSISEEFQSKLNAGKTNRPTASARPDNDPNLNLTTSSRQSSRKRSGTRMSSPNKKSSRSSSRSTDWTTCPICGQPHPIRKEGQCYAAKPETAPAGWAEKHKDKIDAYKKKIKKEKGSS